MFSPTRPSTPDASFTATPRLKPRESAISYDITAGTAAQVAAHLARLGYRRQPPTTSPSERYRLRHANGGLAVLYDSSVLCQGQARHVHEALAGLVKGSK